jgi:hypothetical protein
VVIDLLELADVAFCVQKLAKMSRWFKHLIIMGEIPRTCKTIAKVSSIGNLKD